jgi:arabinofuranan 3-O-arabinosyltransferase
VAQNYNSGWTATLRGRTLKPVRLDGWQQGYLIPAGSAGVVKMGMAPDRPFRLALALGAALLVALLALTLFPARQRRADSGAPREMSPRWVPFTGALVILAVLSGPLALVVVPLLFLARRWGRSVLAVTAFVAFMVAGVAAAWDPAHSGSQGAGAFSGTAQVASVVALAAVLCTLILDGKRRWERKGTSATEDLAATPQEEVVVKGGDLL